jgi:hypothetical protein
MSPFLRLARRARVLLQCFCWGRIIRKYMIANIPAMKMKSDEGFRRPSGPAGLDG